MTISRNIFSSNHTGKPQISLNFKSIISVSSYKSILRPVVYQSLALIKLPKALLMLPSDILSGHLQAVVISNNFNRGGGL